MVTVAKYEMFSNRLQKLYRHRAKVARNTGVSCYRLYDRDLPEFPLIIDYYEGKISISEYISRHRMDPEAYDDWLDKSCDVIKQVLQVKEENIFLRIRKRKESRQDQYRKSDHREVVFMVSEGGLRFKINLSDYLDTGLFLDHRVTREIVRQNSPGRKVLNLFCYTGSFTVYAASGGAQSVVSVDLSNTYLNWAKENMELNGFRESPAYRFVNADVVDYLERTSDEDFDLVILDPPTFSNSKKMKGTFDIQRDYIDLINRTLSRMKNGGMLFFSTNYRKFRFLPESINASEIKNITAATTPFDFAGKLDRNCILLIK